MKKVSFFTIFFICSLFTSFADEISFRGLKMGFSPEEIIKKDGKPNNRWTKEERQKQGRDQVGDLLFEYNNILVAGHIASMQIEFENNKAISALYNFNIKDKQLYGDIPDPTEASLIFDDIKQKMNKIYGNPSKDSIFTPIDKNISSLLAQSINEKQYSVLWFDFKIILFAEVNEKNKWEVSLIYLSEKIYQEMLASQKAQAEKEASTDGL